MKTKFIFLFLFFIIKPSNSNELKNSRFKHLTVLDGLSSKWVKSIYRDKSGFLWIGTADGLNRYDGINFKVYKFSLNDTTSLNHNFISSIYEDKDGNIWIGTQAGLNKYIRSKDCFLRIRGINNYISSFYESQEGALYLGSPGGLFLYFPSNGKVIQLNNNIGIESIAFSPNANYIWLGTRNGLFRFYITQNLIEKVPFSTNHFRIRKLFVDVYNQLWIGTEGGGMFIIENPSEKQNNKLKIRNMEYKEVPININSGTIYAMEEDDKHNLWIGIENGGIFIVPYDQLKKENPSCIHIEHNFFDKYSLGNNSIHSLYFDHQKIMWVGTYGNGLSYTSTLFNNFRHIRHIPGKDDALNNNFVNVIWDEKNFTFIGTEKGLNVYNKVKQKFYYYTYNPDVQYSISSNVVWALYRDSKGILWVGTWNGGLNWFDDKKGRFIRVKYDASDTDYLAGNSVTKIIESKDGIIWMSTMGKGLYSYQHNTKKFTRFRYQIDKNSISSNWIFDIAEDGKGNIWIATTEAVDIFYRKENFFKKIKYNPNDTNSINYNGAVCLYCDSKKNMWIGTSNGLNVYIDSLKIFKHYGERDGLANNSIKAISEDNKKNIWVSTNRGISQLVGGVTIPQQPVFINYTVNDGLQENEFNIRASFRNEEGWIYFGGPNGYNIFHPDSIKLNQSPPNVVFTNIYVFNKPIKPFDETKILSEHIESTSEIRLKKKYSIFTIEFSALNLIVPEKNQFAYFLEGMDKKWNYAGNKHSVTYTYLPAGTYILHVKASNNDGVWNPKEAILKIIILPAWWESTPAKITYVIIFLLILYFFRKYTIINTKLKNKLWLELKEKQKIEELGMLKHQFFTNISHELRTPLTLILGPVNKLIQEGNQSEWVNIIYRNAIRLKTLVDQILDLSKMEERMMKTQLMECDLVHIIDENIKNFIYLAQQKDISLNFISNVSKCIGKFDEDKIDKIITNLISNAIKNTPARGKIQVELSYKKQLQLMVSDNGVGIASEEIKNIFERFYSSINTSISKPGTGIGLNLTHKLVEMLGGTIDVQSEKGIGTKFIITLPEVDISFFEENEFKFSYTGNNTRFDRQKQIFSNVNGSTIMIVDDDEDMCYYVASILGPTYNLIIFSNPQEAFQNLEKNMPHLIISDVMMAGIDGFEFCARIKSDIRFSHIPVILLTAKAGSVDEIKGLESGADDYIIKPFNNEILLLRVKKILTKKDRLRSEVILQDGKMNKVSNLNTLDYAFLERIMNIIKNNFSNPDFNINHIIEEMNMSRSVFYSKYKALSNQSISEVINLYRLNKSKDLLRNTQLSVGEVAMECGFNDPAYFSRLFKHEFGISPKDFRNEKKN